MSEMDSQRRHQLEGLAIGLEQRGEKSAAHMVRLAISDHAALRDAAMFVLTTFRKDEAEGFRSKDRQFAITILGQALSVTNGARDTPGEG